MKRIFSAFMVLTLLLSIVNVVSASDDFVIDNNGEISAYYGEEWVVVPQTIDGIPVTKIGEKAFFDLGIADVYLSDGLSVIGESAFEGCNTQSVTIPSSVKIIGDRAFSNCSELSTVFLSFDENTLIGENAFSGTGFVMFYINCDIDTKAMERKLLQAKGDAEFSVWVRHTEYEYDNAGNGICTACGFYEDADDEALPFTDVSYDAWYYGYVETAYRNNIINGKTDTEFDPDATMTCAEAVKIAACINAIFNEPIAEQSDGLWYQPYIDYCYNHGLLEDYIVFDWDKPITRAQMAYLFSHCEPWDIYINEVPITDIPDVYDTTPFAWEILELYNKGIAVGDDQMNFNPDDNIKRCEVAAIIARIINPDMRVELPKG